MAIGLARAVTGREKVLVFEGAYHGGVLFFKEGESGPVNAPFPFVFGRYNDTEATLSVIERHGSELAAILVEPMMGSGGCIEGDREFLGGLARSRRPPRRAPPLRRGDDLSPRTGRAAGRARTPSRFSRPSESTSAAGSPSGGSGGGRT